MVDRPEYRAGLIKSVLARVEEKPWGFNVRAHVGEADWMKAENAARTEFISAELMMSIDAGIEAEVGLEGFTDFWREYSSHATQINLLRPIADGVVRLFGSPGGMLKLLPRSFGIVGRGLGTMKGKFGEDGKSYAATIEGTLPLSRPDLFAMANAASLEGMIKLVGATGKATADWSESADGRYHLTLEWE